MTFLHDLNSTWSIVLAGGEGGRVRQISESSMPNPSYRYGGTHSMLQHTWDRADRLTDSRQKLTVASRDHWQHIWSQLGEHVEGRVLLQPKHCDTGAEIFLPLTYVRSWNRDATVVIFPCGHFVHPEHLFLEMVRRAMRATEILQDRMILLGSHPTGLELEYGWIEMGSTLGWSSGSCVRQVKAFLEKPDVLQGVAAMANGALWNTLVMTVKVETLWRLGWQCLPELMERFEKLDAAIGTSREGSILEAIYQDMPCRNFSSDLLQCAPESVGVMELHDVLWSDWGKPERIADTLQLLGKESAFPLKYFSEPHCSQSDKHLMEVS